jgi:hypothetical protein
MNVQAGTFTEQHDPFDIRLAEGDGLLREGFSSVTLANTLAAFHRVKDTTYSGHSGRTKTASE